LRRQTFVLVAVFKAGMAGREHLDRFLDEAGQYAATVKGSLASGVVAVAVAVVEAAPPEADGWARGPAQGAARAQATPERPARGRVAMFPVLVDVSTGRVSCPEAPGPLAALARHHVGPFVGGHPPHGLGEG
jgi:hypothetical protein